MSSPELRLATRSSPLALWQAREVERRLRAAHHGLHVHLVEVSSSGDRSPSAAVADIPADGVFVDEARAAVLAGRADVAVHSAKDLPSVAAGGLVIGAVPFRGDPRDALVGATLADLAPGAVVATGSPRRRAQLAWLRPDLTFTALRGNIATRLSKVPPGGAVVVAVAALDRLGLRHEAAYVLSPAEMLPQVGQGAVALECREEDGSTALLLGAIDDPSAHLSLDAERGFLARLGAGCDTPAGALATVAGARVSLEALLASSDGRVLARTRVEGVFDEAGGAGSDDVVPGALAAALGAQAAEELLGGVGQVSGGLPLL
ncbi:MAG: hydroxymethylbilane synthase [Acidimicrobiales bacterium]